jgi:hypothetical protein
MTLEMFKTKINAPILSWIMAKVKTDMSLSYPLRIEMNMMKNQLFSPCPWCCLSGRTASLARPLKHGKAVFQLVSPVRGGGCANHQHLLSVCKWLS